MNVFEEYDIVVVGSGEAGKYLAWTMAKAGHRTALVERRLVGGSCPNIACLPTKNIVHSARVAALARRAQEFGLEGIPLTPSMKGVIDRKRRMVAGLVDLHLGRFQESGTELIMGTARFTDERTLQVALNDGGIRVLRARRLFLNLGSRTAIPNVPGISEAEPMTHIELLELERLPSHLIVLGGGYIGLELAQAMRRFGSAVTLVQRGPQLASTEDPDVGDAILELFRDEGIQVLLNAAATCIKRRSGGEVRVTVEQPDGVREIHGSDLLVATGRAPNTESVGLEKLGVELNSDGYIKVTDRLETTAPSVWALGDCAGSPQFTHAAYDDFRIVRDNLNGGNRSTQNRLVPSCMFTDPELVRVGLNELEAKRRGIQYRLAKMPMSAILRTRTVSEPRGFLKMLIDSRSDEILGFSGFGVEASELLAAVQTAMLAGADFTVLRDALFVHPTVAEGLVFLLGNIPPAVHDPSRPKIAHA